MAEMSRALPRAYIASIGTRENSGSPALAKNTCHIHAAPLDQFIRIFEVCIEGADYFLTYAPPGSDHSVCEGSACRLQADVRSDILPDVFPDTIYEDPVAAVIRLKEGCALQLEDWTAQLALLALEAKESIRRERVICETWFSFELGSSVYLFAYMQPCHLLPETEEGSPQLAVDAVHRKFKMAWDTAIKIPCVLCK